MTFWQLLEYSFTWEALAEFYVFGITMNAMFIILTMFAMFLKVGSFAPHEIMEFQKFSEWRRDVIRETNSPLRRLMNGLLFFVPMYEAIIQCVFIWNLHRYVGIFGIIKALNAIDSISLVPLTDFTIRFK